MIVTYHSKNPIRTINQEKPLEKIEETLLFLTSLKVGDKITYNTEWDKYQKSGTTESYSFFGNFQALSRWASGETFQKTVSYLSKINENIDTCFNIIKKNIKESQKFFGTGFERWAKEAKQTIQTLKNLKEIAEKSRIDNLLITYGGEKEFC